MNKPLRVLIVDDSEDDTLILINELEQNHYVHIIFGSIPIRDLRRL